MRVVRTTDELRRALPDDGTTTAFVPTMGCLHEGHLALMQQGKNLADRLVASVYVNPTQFGPNEDFARYPRTFDADANICAQAGVDTLFAPTTLYAEGGPRVTVQAGPQAEMLCGLQRPGHFDGVLTVVAILFHRVRPTTAIFGEKDYQQLTLIRQMVSDLSFPVQIVAGATVRESDGLAKSSRNRYLTPAERQQATALWQALSAMQRLAAAGERNTSALLAAAGKILHDAAITPEYLEIRDGISLSPLTELQAGSQPRALVAARVGTTRLIDNTALEHQ